MSAPVRFDALPHGRVLILEPLDQLGHFYALISPAATRPVKRRRGRWVGASSEVATFKPGDLVRVVDDGSAAEARP